MSDLYDAGQSPLRAAHKYLVARDPLYRVALAAAPIALAVALLAATVSAIWTPATPLPPPAVPAPAAPPQAPASPAAPPQAPAPRVDYQALRDRAVSDAAARSDLLARADTGDAEAQFWAATLYDPLLPDVRFAKDGAVAAQWYAKSAAQGDMSSENNLGGLYENGLGVAPDTAMAAHWYRKAADQGDSSAENNLGRLYESGNGVPKDEAEAVRWYRMAADQGYAPAESNLGRVYEAGLGIAKDEATAAMWYAKAAQAGLANAQLRLGYLYESDGGSARTRLPRRTGSGRRRRSRIPTRKTNSVGRTPSASACRATTSARLRCSEGPPPRVSPRRSTILLWRWTAAGGCRAIRLPPISGTASRPAPACRKGARRRRRPATG